MKELWRVGCKANLTLRITGVRDNGYHTIDSFFWPIETPYDVVHCTSVPGERLCIECDTADIDPIHNTLTRAHTAFAVASGYAPGLHLRLEKGIPTGAGLGGGSADAAALLRFLQAQAPVPLSPESLHNVALGVGADVPFFLHNVPCRVRGMGQDITPCPESVVRAFAGITLLCLCPPVHVSTAWAYAAWDAAQDKNTQDILTTPMDNAKEIDPNAMHCVHCINDFETVVFGHYPQLRVLKEYLLCQGAVCAVMSGSGACVLGLFREADRARCAAAQAQNTGNRAYLTDMTRLQ